MLREICLVVLLYVAFASSATCPTREATTESIDFQQLAGKWYVRKSFGDTISRLLFKCNENDVIIASSSTIHEKKTQQLKWPSWTFTLMYSLQLGNTPIQLLEIPLSTLANIILGSFTVKVLDTDYTSYLILEECKNYLLFTKESSWILTRERNSTLSEDDVETALTTAGLEYSKYRDVSQSGC